ncbi:hypothetical protein PBV87_20740 [Niameybacter massiliensis]|uniref:Uncharacterized protein n=1 Tax=Holtiella tumoricola TaxID=3018743 RepID=A0AA42DR88_9FIRM|nr:MULTISPECIES: hypothetical protein [Lachnospirales]MDA3733905.1 hypothetical protein [Holtiella tumoricola]
MEDIIKEIIKIDSNALENKKQQESRINERKAYYEAQMEAYEKERLASAKEKAEETYQSVIKAADEQYKFEEEKAKKQVLLIENKYLQVEGPLLEQVFNKLFLVEA